MYPIHRNACRFLLLVGLSAGSLPSCSDHRSSEFEERKQARQALLGTHLPSLSVGEAEYSDVEIRTVTPAGIRILHSEGVAQVAFENLPSELREAAMYDPVEAKTYSRGKRTLEENRKRRIEELKLKTEFAEVAQPKIPADEQKLNREIELEIKRSHRIQSEIRASITRAAALTRNSAKWKSTWKRIRLLELQRSEHEEKVRKAKRLLAEKETVRHKRERTQRL